MKRLLAFGLVGPGAAWVTFCLFVLASSVAASPDSVGRSLLQFRDLVVGTPSIGRVLAMLPMIGLSLAAMACGARARRAGSTKAAVFWNMSAALLLGAPALLLGLIVLPGPIFAVFGWLVSGSVALAICNLIAGAGPSAPPPGVELAEVVGSRKVFGLRRG